MGLLDNVKKAAAGAREQAGQLADKHGDTIDRAIDRGGSMIDQRTHGRYSDKISRAQQAARNAADKVAADADRSQTSGGPDPVHGTPPAPGHAPPPPGQPADLPSPVRELVAAVNAHDEQAFLDSLGDAGVVDDWGREFVGRQAIKAWSDVEFIGAQGTMDVQRVDSTEGRVVVVADWRSTHANGLSEFTFDTSGGTVTRMTIRGAH